MKYKVLNNMVKMIYSNYRLTANPFDLGIDEYLASFTDPNQAVHIVGYFPDIDKSLVSGEIWLYRGKHKYKYGLDHIWAGRSRLTLSPVFE